MQVRDVLFLFMEVGGLINFQKDEGPDSNNLLDLRDILLKSGGKASPWQSRGRGF